MRLYKGLQIDTASSSFLLAWKHHLFQTSRILCAVLCVTESWGLVFFNSLPWQRCIDQTHKFSTFNDAVKLRCTNVIFLRKSFLHILSIYTIENCGFSVPPFKYQLLSFSNRAARGWDACSRQTLRYLLRERQGLNFPPCRAEISSF